MFASSRMLYSIGTLLCLAALMVACAGQVPASPEPEQAEHQTKPAVPTVRPPATEFTSPEEHGVSPLPTPTDVTELQPGGRATRLVPIEVEPPDSVPTQEPGRVIGEVPQDLLEAVFEDLLERLDVGREAIVVEQAEYVIWRDGSLGCPQPGMMYTMALVPGYRIVLRVGDETFDYHASERGYFVLCEGGLAEEPLPPGSGVDPSPRE